MAAPFERLPEELKDIIFEQCEKETLQSSRLACRSFVPTVNRHLFKTITVNIIHSDINDRLINIAADPDLARCVKHLVVRVGMEDQYTVNESNTIWYQLCLYLEPRFPESDSWILDIIDRRPWPHCQNPMKPTIQAIFRAIESLKNISSVSSDVLDPTGSDLYDPSMNIFMLALSRRLHSVGCFRSGLSVSWGQVSQRHLVNIWERQHMRRTHRRNIEDHPIPIFGMIKHLDLYQIQPMRRPCYRGFADEGEVPEGEAKDVLGIRSGRHGNDPDIDDDYDPNLYCNQLRLSSLCSQEVNTVESLRLDFNRNSLEPTGFTDDLKPWKALSLSPHLSKVTLISFITASDTFLNFLRHVSPTLRDFRLEDASILPCNTESREEVTIVKNWIIEHQCKWILDRDPSPPDQFWERVVFEMREILSSSPLSSFHMSYLIETVGANYNGVEVEWEYSRDLLADDDNDEYDEDWPGNFRGGCEFYRHQFESIHDYVLGHRESLPPLDWRDFKKKHAQEGCDLCAKACTPLPSPTEIHEAEE